MNSACGTIKALSTNKETKGERGGDLPTPRTGEVNRKELRVWMTGIRPPQETLTSKEEVTWRMKRNEGKTPPSHKPETTRSCRSTRGGLDHPGRRGGGTTKTRSARPRRGASVTPGARKKGFSVPPEKPRVPVRITDMITTSALKGKCPRGPRPFNAWAGWGSE